MPRKRYGLHLDIAPSEQSSHKRKRASEDSLSRSAEISADGATVASSSIAGSLSPSVSPAANPLVDHLRPACNPKDDVDSRIHVGSRLLVLNISASGTPSQHLTQGARAGQELEVLDYNDNQVKLLRPLSGHQYHNFLNISARLNAEEDGDIYDNDQVHLKNLDVKNSILPYGCEIISDMLPKCLRDENASREASDFTGSSGTCLMPLLLAPLHYGDLHSFIREKKHLEEPLIRFLFYQIVLLTYYCHKHGILMRDLKLRKFVFTNQERTFIRLDTLDDLFVCPNPDDDLLSDRHGCPAYVSPELLALDQSSYAGKPADMWSLGVLLFVMSFGRYPFYDPTPSGLFSRIRTGTYCIPSNSGFSAQLLILIRSLLSQSPTERPIARELFAYPWLQLSTLPQSEELSTRRNIDRPIAVRRPQLDDHDRDFIDEVVWGATGSSSGAASLSDEDWVVPNVDAS